LKSARRAPPPSGSSRPDGGAYRPEREAEVLRRNRARQSRPLANVRSRLFTEIISACRALEQPLARAYLGPQGTFHEMALAKAVRREA